MSSVSKLNFNSQWVYRVNPPKGQYFIDFKLDSKSEAHLIQEAQKLDSAPEVKKFEQGIEEAAIIAALKILKSELVNNNVAEYMRIQIDPKHTGRMFAFQIKQGSEVNKLEITKAQVMPQEPFTERSFSFKPQTISTGISIEPIFIEYVLLYDTIKHLEKYTEKMQTMIEIENLEKQIRRAVRIAAHKMTNNCLMLRPEGTKLKWIYEDLESNRKFKFLFTIINGRMFIVNKIRIMDL